MNTSGLPIINNYDVEPILTTYGGVVNVELNVTDNIGVDSVLMNVTYPNGVVNSFDLININV